MIVTLSSVGGSPGVTSWSLLLAAAWPGELGRERVVLEADLDGGVLGARYGLGVEPGVVSLIAALRRNGDVTVPVELHGRDAGGGVWLVPGPESGEQAAAVWRGTAEAVAERLAADERVWLVDAGRLAATLCTAPLADSAELAVVVARSGHEHLVQVPARVAALRERSRDVAVMVVGRSRYDHGELSEFFGVDQVWTVGASADVVSVAGAALAPGRSRRTWLWRTALDVAAEVAARVHASPSTPAAAADELDGQRAEVQR